MFGLFKTKPEGMTRERAEAIINAYGAVMMNDNNTISDERDLPFSRGEIKEAIRFGIAASVDPQSIDMLKTGYVILSQFLLLNDQERVTLRQQRDWEGRAVDPSALTREDATEWANHRQAHARLQSRVEANAMTAAHEIEQFLKIGEKL